MTDGHKVGCHQHRNGSLHLGDVYREKSEGPKTEPGGTQNRSFCKSDEV